MSEMWEAVSGAWEENATFVDEHVGEVTAAMIATAQLRPGDAVIDLACGPGGAGLAAAPVVTETGRVVLADVAPGMVAAAGRRAAGLPQVDTLACDELAIDAPAESFDAAICRFGLMFAEPPEDAVREAARVLKPGGRYVAMTWASRAENQWLGLIFDAVGEQFGVPFPPPSLAGPFALEDPARLEAALAGGGLTDVDVQKHPATFRVSSLEEWWDRVPKFAGPLAMALGGMEPDVRDAIRDRALAKGEAAIRTTADGVELTGAVLIGSGRRG
jgi:SAM-dependent methyltransferase